MKKARDSKSRLDALKKLLGQGSLRTQDDLRERLENQGFVVTQSTISRDLRKLGTIKSLDQKGRTIYRLYPEQANTLQTAPLLNLILDINSNSSLIVIHTHPGSASLVARHLDQNRPGGILGTIAGDDTVFVALSPHTPGKTVIAEIERYFNRKI